jgi:hypothetical protein
MPTIAAFTDWLTGISGALAFAATAVLAGVAVAQMRKLSSQAREQASALQQPMVFAHGDETKTWPEGTGEPNPNEAMLGPGQVGFGYKLANEGTGLAMNIRHGVEVAGKRLEFGDGMQFRSLPPGEWHPARDFLQDGVRIRIRPFYVVVNVNQLPADYLTQPRHYWADFDNVFGERFRTRNPNDPTKSAAFERLA